LGTRSLEAKLKTAGSVPEMLRNAPVGFYPFPMPSEHTNWRDEQTAWAQTAVLFDLSYHMTDIYIKGPDTKRLLADTSINDYTKLEPLKAFQYVACADSGKIIGDAIGFCLRDGTVNLVGKPPAGNYITYVAETGNYDVNLSSDLRSLESGRERLTFRFQVQGPNANKILEKVNCGPLPPTRFFGMCEFRIAGHLVTALRHSMTGAPGMEFFGPHSEREAVWSALMEAGKEFGLRAGGARAYATTAPQSGWVGALLPAIYTGDDLRAYREWLPDTSFEANLSLGGSLTRENLEDYYIDPWDAGYDRLIDWNHPFKGREALLKMSAEKHRRKVWLKWNPEDVLKVIDSAVHNGPKYKFLEWPAAHYATCPFDQVLDGARPVGMSVYAAYNAYVQGWFSIGLIAEDQVEYGKEVTIVWGEPHGGSRKPTVEPHVQTEIRATISKSALG
jgi:glycine cleavage system aminomethyltransferase T